MSQSDYIQHKRVAVELKTQSKLPSTIESGKYTNYKEFELENTIASTKLRYDKLLQANSVNVFGVPVINAQNCTTFTLCSGTNTRPNRKPIQGTRLFSMPLKLKPAHKTADKTPVCNSCLKI
jgi:hypothetical protein